ncbi:MAG TPA: serine/threonine-protein kinase, partial [Polyangiales bacterium]|nr:serine/threonine-protein kinase [Polyangiales bacterium]
MQISDPPGEALRTVTLSIVPVRPAAERYEIGEELGRGGMAVVHAATDRANGRKLALKRLLVQGDAPKQRRSAELFEREYLALAQLTHPCIVTVHDYGIDLEGAYYTMELVDGADLQQLSPLPWRQAVALARDCCSALAFLHSRRLVHRDISPRNLRKTASGRGKLLDFGALAPFGLSKLIVGTPPCCAPEVLQLQALDGRADIYALGTVLYYTLVGQHAYAARNFSMLSQLWQSPPVPPSQFVPDVPAELDALVLDLLRLDPDARPASAAEVLQRLSAIDGESPGDEAYAAQAYLATPPLVGREDALARARRKLKRSMYGTPHALVVDGISGVGRSRLLGACLLEATLLGVCVARADADDALHG